MKRTHLFSWATNIAMGVPVAMALLLGVATPAQSQETQSDEQKNSEDQNAGSSDSNQADQQAKKAEQEAKKAGQDAKKQAQDQSKDAQKQAQDAQKQARDAAQNRAGNQGGSESHGQGDQGQQGPDAARNQADRARQQGSDAARNQDRQNRAQQDQQNAANRENQNRDARGQQDRARSQAGADQNDDQEGSGDANADRQRNQAGQDARRSADRARMESDRNRERSDRNRDQANDDSNRDDQNRDNQDRAREGGDDQDRSARNRDERRFSAETNRSEARDERRDDRREDRRENRRESRGRQDLGLSFNVRDNRLAVTNITRTSVIARAGVRQGDVIVSVNGRNVASQDEFNRYIYSVQPRERVTIVVLRDGREETLYVEDLDLGAVEHSAPRASRVALGVTIDQQYQGEVVIREARSGGPAAEAGLRRGDALLTIDGQEFSSLEEMKDVLSQYNPGDEVEVEYERGRNVDVAVVRLDAAQPAARARVNVETGPSYDEGSDARVRISEERYDSGRIRDTGVDDYRDGDVRYREDRLEGRRDGVRIDTGEGSIRVDGSGRVDARGDGIRGGGGLRGRLRGDR